MTFSNIPLAHTVAALCKNHGVRQIVISPGSRNAPLILAFTGDYYFECFSVVDERSAGFFALGLSQQSGMPTALICSSGSALLNYYPAVAEAYYSRIPIVVLSADRPEYMVDIGDGQTIRQQGVFANHIGFEANLKQDLTHATRIVRQFVGVTLSDESALQAAQQDIQTSNEDQICKALVVALQEQLPVHLNIPLEEPLYGTQATPPLSCSTIRAPQDNSFAAPPQIPTAVWHSAPRKMVLIGSMRPGVLSNAVLALLAEDQSVVVFTETTSNVHHSAFFPSIDSIIAPLERNPAADRLFKELQPTILLTIGGMVVSKKIKQFLRKFTPEQHWHVDPQMAYNTYFCLKEHFKCTPNTFLTALYAGNSGGSPATYKNFWFNFQNRISELREHYVSKIPFSDFKAFYHIFKSIPRGAQLQLANSATIRYAQLFSLDASNPVFCNRGTSGIEGSTSTAVGAAWNYPGQTVYITGDLSFLYDANGFWNRAIKSNFRVIVMHNGGGGIFRILPGFSESATFETYFETVHQHDMKSVCQHYGFHYFRANTEADLLQVLNTFYATPEGPALLEVRTPRAENNQILLGYFDSLNWQ
ncbi:MAG: hypothetical protein RLZZ241_170 [Bacteroidota bacterium]